MPIIHGSSSGITDVLVGRVSLMSRGMFSPSSPPWIGDDEGSICIPKWYRFGMSTQIAVRLPDDIVAFLDSEVSQNHAPSRAAVVLRALEREKRRQIALRDAAILARGDADAEMDSLAGHVAGLPIGLD